jgi:Na+-translocating ferredoxin:NAD+ oxidoreductase RnfG subunit
VAGKTPLRAYRARKGKTGEAAVQDMVFKVVGKGYGGEEGWRCDFDQFAGATITPRAVVGAIKKGLETFARHTRWRCWRIPRPHRR